MNATPSLPVLRFGRCELDAQARELRVDGQAVTLEPRPFDVLVWLLQHRDDTVSTDELVAQVWRGEPVANGAVANAVAKLRRAIGDEGEPPLIRTVHRVGYRFVGDVVQPQAPEPARLQPAAGPPPTPVVVLPLENLTGSPSLDWVSLGLMSMLNEALAEDGRLAPVPVSTTVEVLQRLPADGSAAQKAHALQQFTGARHVVRARLSRQGDGYTLDCLLTRPGAELQASLRGPDPAAAGRELARWLQAQLQPGTAPATARSPQDPWLLEVHARALEAVAQGRWQDVVTMETVVLDAEPGHAAARLELLRARAMLHEAAGHFGAALDLWRESVALAQATGMGSAATRANACATLAASMCGLSDEALSRAADGLAHAQASGHPHELWRRAPLLWQAQGMAGQALRLQLNVPAPADPDAPADVRAGWHGWRGIQRSLKGDQDGAAEEVNEAAQLYRSAGAVGRESALLAWWLLRLVHSGRLDAAGNALGRLEDCGRQRALLARGLPCLRATLRHAQGDTRRALDELQPTLQGASLDLSHAAACTLAARWLADAGDLPQARSVLAAMGPSFWQHDAFRPAIGRLSHRWQRID